MSTVLSGKNAEQPRQFVGVGCSEGDECLTAETDRNRRLFRRERTSNSREVKPFSESDDQPAPNQARPRK